MFFVPNADESLVAYLGSKPSWLMLFGDASPLRGGQWRLELREQYMSRLPVPTDLPGFENLAPIGASVQLAHEKLSALNVATLHRLADIAPTIETTAAFRAWPAP